MSVANDSSLERSGRTSDWSPVSLCLSTDFTHVNVIHDDGASVDAFFHLLPVGDKILCIVNVAHGHINLNGGSAVFRIGRGIVPFTVFHVSVDGVDLIGAVGHGLTAEIKCGETIVVVQFRTSAGHDV